MKRLLAVLLVCLVGAAPAVSATSLMPEIRVTGAWIRLLPGDLPAGGYMTIANLSDSPRTLVSVSSEDYGHVMLHLSMQDSGMSHMKSVDSVSIPAHGEVAFAPGSYHLMLMQRRHPVKVGQVLMLKLHFADGSARVIGFEVRPANATGADGG